MEYYLKALRHYADFSGRASRKEYWMFILFNIIFIFAAAFLGAIIVFAKYGENQNQELVKAYAMICARMYYFAIAIPFLAVSVRRLHDSGKSGWWMLLPALAQALNLIISNISDVDEGLLIFASLLMLAAYVCIFVLMLLGSNENANRYGLHPKNIIAYGRHTFTRSLGLTLIISMALSVVAIIFKIIFTTWYFEFMTANILNFLLSSNIIFYLLVMAAGIALLRKKEINATFALLLMATALLWIFRDIYAATETMPDILDISLTTQIMLVLNKLLILIPVAMLMAGMAYLNKSKPDMTIIKMNPRIAALSLIGVSVFDIIVGIYYVIVEPAAAFTDITNIVHIVIPVTFITLATYLLRGYDMLQSETTDVGGNDAQKYENRQHIKAPNMIMHLVFSIINIVVGAFFLLGSIGILIGGYYPNIGFIFLIISLFLLITGFIYVLQRKKGSQILRTLNIIAAVISFILIALMIIGIIIGG
jgi:uncharacterized membrane protein YhaH (DUF805 family)